jgi:integrase
VTPLTVREAWKAYEPVCEQNQKAALTEKCRSEHLLRHLGSAKVAALSVADVDRYRALQLAERSIRGTPPASSTLDFEVELLKRILNYAVESGAITVNPIARAKLLQKPNVRTSVIDEEIFRRLSDVCDPALRPILTVAFDTGMRKREILDLRWEQVDLKLGIIRLAPQDTKGKEHRPVYMTARVRRILNAIPRQLHTKHVFLNPKTMARWRDIDRMFKRARQAIGMEGLWFHDMRRSFVTRARRAGVPESVVMRMSGHRTREVFERYNIVSEADLEGAVRRLENFGHVLDKVDESATSGAAKP